MLDDNGEITLVPEILALLEEFVRGYEARQGPVHSDVERALVVTYALAILRREAEALAACIVGSPAFVNQDPRHVLAQVLGDTAAADVASPDVRRQLAARGWLPG